ncbi:MAG: restriction endonuclease subunit S [bacterium]
MKFKKYSKYKESNNPWLERIPDDWDEKKLLAELTIVNKSVPSEVIQQKERVFHYSIPNYDAFEDGLIEEGNTIDSNKYVIRGGEVLISKLNPRKSRVLITKKQNDFSVCSTEFIPLNVAGIDKKYLTFLFSSEVVRQKLDSLTNSATNSHKRVNPSIIPRLELPLPEKIEEQEQIANLLEKDNFRINKTIEYYKKEIKLLKEKRIAIISHAVTKGINSMAKMKDSGINWNPLTPLHWKASKLGYYSQIKTGGTPSTDNLGYWENGDINWMTSGEVNKINVYDTDKKITKLGLKKSNASLLPVGTVMMALSGQGKTKGMVAILHTESTCSQSLAGIICNRKLNSKFLFYYLTKNYRNIRGLVGDNLRDGLNLKLVADFKILLPPISEQKEIIQYIDSETSKIDTLIQKIEKQISLLEEYKVSLITHAVTGKIDVRGVA